MSPTGQMTNIHVTPDRRMLGNPSMELAWAKLSRMLMC
jgi:hypothetical protein